MTEGKSCILAIRAMPGASHDRLDGWMGDTLKLRVRAPALDGRANSALCTLLADALGLPHRAVSVAHGLKSRQKLVRIAGLLPGEVRGRLGAAAT